MLITIEQAQKIPNLYAQEEEQDPIVYLKIKCGNSFWLITECDSEGLAFGWADMYGDGSCGELGYIHLNEIDKLQFNYSVSVEEVKKPLSEMKKEFYNETL